LFGWDYVPLNPLGDDEVDWYLHWAKVTGGPILCLACGTGRLPCRFAAEGYTVTGVDLSEAMLDIARSNVQALTPQARGRVDLVRGDMASFDLKRRFGLVVIADNSFRELSTRKQLRRCLRSARRHLRPAGKLLITVRRFRPELYPNGVRRFGWSEPMRNEDTGETARRRAWVRLHKGGRRLSGRFEYEIVRPDGSSEVVRCPWSAPVLDEGEYRSLFQRSGFATEVYSDYRLVSRSDEGNLWCFVCSPA
jgi:SAM-dependent methyltransferase